MQPLIALRRTSRSLPGHLTLWQIFWGVPMAVVFLRMNYVEGTLSLTWALWCILCASAGALVVVTSLPLHFTSVPLSEPVQSSSRALCPMCSGSKRKERAPCTKQRFARRCAPRLEIPPASPSRCLCTERCSRTK